MLTILLFSEFDSSIYGWDFILGYVIRKFVTKYVHSTLDIESVYMCHYKEAFVHVDILVMHPVYAQVEWDNKTSFTYTYMYVV